MELTEQETLEKLKQEYKEINELLPTEPTFDLDRTLPVAVSKMQFYNELTEKFINIVKDNFETLEDVKIMVDSPVLPIFQLTPNYFKPTFIDEIIGTYKAGGLKANEETYIDVLVSPFFEEKGEVIIYNKDKAIYGYIRNKI